MSYSRLVTYPTPSTSLGLYAVLRDRSTGKVYNTATTIVETWVDASLEEYVLNLTFLGGDSYGFTVPDDLPHATYVASFYKPTGGPGVFSLTDLKLPREWEFRWVGRAVDPSPPGSPVSDLITDYNKFLRCWGERNVVAVSNKDDDAATTVDTLVVQDAFDYADAEVYKALRGSAYSVPLNFSARTDGAVDPVVENWAFVIAYSHLYYGRFDEPESEIEIGNAMALRNKVSNMVKVVYASMLEVRHGLSSIDAARGTLLDLSPSIISQYDIDTTVSDDYLH